MSFVNFQEESSARKYHLKVAKLSDDMKGNSENSGVLKGRGGFGS